MFFHYLVTTVLPLMIFIVMLGLGLTLTADDFKRVFKFPRPVIIGLSCQILILPLLAFALCFLFGLSPAFAVGLMILAASPGGLSSNIFSHLCRGDVALNLSITAINTVISTISLPILTAISLAVFADETKSIGLQYSKMFEIFFLVFIPACIGLAINRSHPALARRLDKPMQLFSISALVLIVAVTVTKEWTLLTENLNEVGPAVLTFNILSLALGFYVPRFFKISQKQAISIALEVGIHNGALALYMAISILGSTVYAVPAAIYSVLMYFTASLLCWYLRLASR